jgi:hypothetical protein
MSYMLSKESYLSDNAPSDLSHVMFFVATRKPTRNGVGSCRTFPLGLFHTGSQAQAMITVLP